VTTPRHEEAVSFDHEIGEGLAFERHHNSAFGNLYIEVLTSCPMPLATSSVPAIPGAPVRVVLEREQ
jgi:hypothetical protein